MYTQQKCCRGSNSALLALFSCWMTHTCEISRRASRLSRVQMSADIRLLLSQQSSQKTARWNNFRVQVSFDVSQCSFADAPQAIRRRTFIYPRKNELREQEIHFPVGIRARLPDYESVAAFVMLNATQFLTLPPVLFISPRMHVQFGPGRIQITAGTQLCLLSRLRNVHICGTRARKYCAGFAP